MNKIINPESDLIQKLAEIEKKYAVEELLFNDISIWPILKLKLYYENWTHINKSNDKLRNLSNSKFKQFILSGFKLLILDFKNLMLLKKADIILFADPVNRRVSITNKMYEIYTDPLFDEIQKTDKTTLVVERNSTSDYPTPRYSKSAPQFLLQLLFSPYMFKKITLSTLNLKLLSDIKADLENSGYLSNSLTEKMVYKFLKVFNLHFRMYRFMFKVCSPRFIILTEWYSIVSMAAIAAAKKANVTSIELQHGVQSNAHIAYGNWFKSNVNAMTLFPDIFWIWSKADYDNIIQNFSKFGAKAFFGGNLFLDKFKKSEISISREEELIQILPKSKKICLVTLQPIYELHDSLLNYISSIKKEYFFLFRLHPVMSRDTPKYESLIKKRLGDLNYDLRLSTELALPILLKHSNLHLTYNSSTVIEAAYLNVPSIIFDRDLGPLYYKEQISNNLAFIDDTKNVMCTISSSTKIKNETESINTLLK